MQMLPHRTLIDALAAAPPQRPFVTMWSSEEDVQTLTFSEFRQWAEAQAAQFRGCGLGHGDNAVLIMPQGVEVMTAFVGAMLLGAAPAILAHPNFKVEPAKYRFGLAGVLANLKARLLVIDESFPSELLDCVTVGPETKLVRSLTSTGLAACHQLPPERFGPEGLAFIQHSAGTTGLQKGVALSHAAVLRQLAHLVPAIGLTEQDRIYSWLPLYHDMGLIACFMLPLVYHVPLVMQSPLTWVMQPRTMLRLISDYRCTLSWLPNFAFQFLARRVRPEDRAGLDLSSVRMLINCSEPVRAESVDEFLNAYSVYGLKPKAVQSSYAMAENVFAVTQSGTLKQPRPRRIWVDGNCFRQNHIAAVVGQESDGATCFVSSGRCLTGNDVRIVSNTGEALPDGQVGEILIRSDSLFDGYYGRPDLSAKALQDGWYYSGDLGFVLEGELYVVGRKKDLIIVGGQNIYPQDVEKIAFSHPAIHDGRAVAFGLYNPDLGTEDIVVVAEVEDEKHLENAVAVEREIRAAVVAELGVAVRAVYLKPPRWIVKSTAGKPARSTTREKLLKEHPELASTEPSSRSLERKPETDTSLKPRSTYVDATTEPK